jgi:RNA polymerase sigma-70 factor (ECF subfamily)
MVRPVDSDTKLLAAACEDPRAFALFYRRHAEAVLAHLLRRSRDRELSAELLAEVFAAALAAPRRSHPRRSPPRAWLFGIANNKLSEHYRHGAIDDRARRRLGMQLVEFTDAELERAEDLVDLERRGLSLRALVDDLPIEQREAVLARVVDERGYEEIAAQAGCSQATIRQRVSRGLSRLALWNEEGRT